MLGNLIRHIESFDINSAIKEALEEVEHVLVDTVTEDQLYNRGVNSKNEEIASYAPYSPLTIEIKTGLGQPTDRVTLNFTGAFHASVYIEFNNDNLVFKSDDSKFEDLTWAYGKDILGLTPENIGWIAEDYIYPKVVQKLRQWN